MIVELFYSPGCARCAASQAKLKAVALETIEDLTWREVNVLDELDYAVELGSGRKFAGAMINGWKAYNITSDPAWGIGAWV